ncbi:MAG: hypothetical protein HYS21_11020 [Deltaproteobacteria bacterium]|nr:hypothetical protein [Deltaproteobacteria bacterium]
MKIPAIFTALAFSFLISTPLMAAEVIPVQMPAQPGQIPGPATPRDFMTETMINENSRLMEDTMSVVRDFISVMKDSNITPEQKRRLETLDSRINVIMLQHRDMMMRYRIMPR